GAAGHAPPRLRPRAHGRGMERPRRQRRPAPPGRPRGPGGPSRRRHTPRRAGRPPAPARLGAGAPHRPGPAAPHPALRYETGQVLTVRPAEPALVQVDGDVLTDIVRARITIEPGALLVAAP